MFKIRIPYKIRMLFNTGKTLAMWVPFILKDPRRIRFFPQWIFSFLPGRAAFKDGFPLIPFEAVQELNSFLTKEMNVFEWGSGGSTVFFAKRIKSLVSIEHDSEWYGRVKKVLEERGLGNHEYILKKPQKEKKDGDQSYLSTSSRYEGLNFKEYCKAIELYPDSFFDAVMVDGRMRINCIFHALKKIRPNGLLILDDSNAPHYAPGIELLKGWKRKDFQGPKPYAIDFYHTTIWQKPAL